MDRIKRHPELFTLLGLGALCLLVFFFGIGSYPLMDVDETRYASMARDMFTSKDFLTLYLNGEYFFEKPPLYFWLECASFALFGKVNEFTVRFPAALCGALSTFLLYFAGKKAVSRKYGIVAAVILATSLQFNVLAKFAILDITVATCVGFSVLFGFMTFYVQERNKKYFWWLFYAFSGLAVMAKGVPGFIVPFGVMFFAYVKNLREVFRPQYILVGAALFLLIVLPWHIVMLKMYPGEFWHEYFIKHHFQRFVNSAEIGRKEPWFFYILTFLVGFLPWILPTGVNIIRRWRERCSFKITNQWLYLNTIAFVFTMLFFSASSTKLITYILPVYFFAACIAAFAWQNMRRFAITAGVTACVLAFLTGPAFRFDFAFGQDDLMRFAKLTQDKPLASFGFGRRYSLIYYHGGHVEMQRAKDFVWLKDALKTHFIVVRNKDLLEFAQHAKFEIVETGKKYSLIRGRHGL